MLIDIQTFFWQILNFVVLVALLKRFLYKPILQAMRRREQFINGQLQDAAEQKAIAQAEAEHYRQLQASFEAQREDREAQARLAVEEYRQARLTEARAAVEATQLQWADRVRQEQQNFLVTLRQQMGFQLLKTIRTVLNDLAQTHLEDQIILVFLKRLAQLSTSEQEALRQALCNTGAADVVIHSAFPLSADYQLQIRQTLAAYQAEFEMPGRGIRFELQPMLLCGIELSLPGYKLAWTIDHYLHTLEERVTQLLEREQHVFIPDMSKPEPLK